MNTDVQTPPRHFGLAVCYLFGLLLVSFEHEKLLHRFVSRQLYGPRLQHRISSDIESSYKSRFTNLMHSLQLVERSNERNPRTRALWGICDCVSSLCFSIPEAFGGLPSMSTF